MSILGGRKRYRKRKSTVRRRRRRSRRSYGKYKWGINGKLIRHEVPNTLFRGIKKGRGKVTDVASKALELMKVIGLGKYSGGVKWNVNGGRRRRRRGSVRRHRHRTYIIKGGAHESTPMKLNSFLLQKIAS